MTETTVATAQQLFTYLSNSLQFKGSMLLHNRFGHFRCDSNSGTLQITVIISITICCSCNLIGGISKYSFMKVTADKRELIVRKHGTHVEDVSNEVSLDNFDSGLQKKKRFHTLYSSLDMDSHVGHPAGAFGLIGCEILLASEPLWRHDDSAAIECNEFEDGEALVGEKIVSRFQKENEPANFDEDRVGDTTWEGRGVPRRIAWPQPPPHPTQQTEP